jgi:hypothetical protein
MSKLIVVHDRTGHLIAVGEAYSGPHKNVGVRVIPQEGQFVFEVEKTREFKGKTLHEIHKTYRADVAAQKLIKAAP